MKSNANAMDKPSTNKGMEVRIFEGPWNCAIAPHRKAMGVREGGILEVETEKGLMMVEVKRAPKGAIKQLKKHKQAPVLVLDRETLFSLYSKAGEKALVRVVEK
jgi:hypothetical protein